MRRRLLLSYLTITVFVLVVLEIPLGLAYARFERRRLTSGVQHDALALSIRAEESLERNDLAGLRNTAASYQHRVGGRVVVVDRNGALLADSDPPAPGRRNFESRPEIARALRGKEVTGSRHSNTLRSSLLYVAVPIVNGGTIEGAVRVTYPMSYVDARVRHNWYVLGGIGAVVLGIVFLVSLRLARAVSRPLQDLESAAARLGRGDLSARAAVPRGPPEARALAESFNATAARLERLVESQRAFVADASHQLRTPLAALRLRLENLEDEIDESTRAEDLAGALDEVARLSRLVDGLLELARAEERPTAPVAMSVGEFVEGRVAAWSALATERDVRLQSSMPAPAPHVLVTPGRLEQVLDNLLNNALEVAPPGSTVSVQVTRRAPWVQLSVADAGPGMSAAQRGRAFDRFWRAPGSSSGAGLGLAIVRELVQADGGEVSLDDAPDGGLVVELRLREARPGAARPSARPGQSESTTPARR